MPDTANPAITAAEPTVEESTVEESSAAEPTVDESSAAAGVAPDPGRPPADDLLVREGDIAGDYLERLLDIIDSDGDIDMDVEGERAVVAVVGPDLDKLVGPGGATLEALQELTRLAVLRETGVRSRLMLDIGGHRARRREQLTGVGTRAAHKAIESGQSVALEPMTPFERKVVHDAVATVEGAHSESDGVEPDRYVVVLPG